MRLLKKGRIDKKKADDMPKDSLGILTLGGSEITRIPRVKSFAFPEQWGAGSRTSSRSPPRPTATRKSKKDAGTGADAPDDDQAKKDDRGTPVTLRELATGKEWQFRFADEYIFSKTGGRFLVSTTGGDSASVPGVFTFDTGTSRLDTLAIGRGKYKQIALDEAGTQAAFLADRDTSKAKQRFFALHWWTAGQDSASRVVDTLTAGMKPRWTVSENGDVRFSRNGRRVFFGTAPVPVPDDTTFNDEETAQLDVWHWQDLTMQPEQLKNLDKEKKRTYAAVWHVDRRAFVQLGDQRLPEVEPGNRGDADVAMATSDLPYQRERMWTGVTDAGRLHGGPLHRHQDQAAREDPRPGHALARREICHLLRLSQAALVRRQCRHAPGRPGDERHHRAAVRRTGRPSGRSGPARAGGLDRGRPPVPCLRPVRPLVHRSLRERAFGQRDGRRRPQGHDPIPHPAPRSGGTVPEGGRPGAGPHVP